MKCDNLKVYVPQDGPWGLEPEEGGKLVEEETCYIKSEVDAAIDELKTEHHKERHEYISMVHSREKKIKELEAKLEDAKATAYAESVDAGMRERRLQRALWLARAERAVAKQAYYDVLSRGVSSERGEMYDVWENVESKCRAKAEQYK